MDMNTTVTTVMTYENGPARGGYITTITPAHIFKAGHFQCGTYITYRTCSA